MIRRRELISAGVVVSALCLPRGAIAEPARETISWTFWQAPDAGFRRTPVLLTGRRDAILLDGGFTLSDGRELAAAIKGTGKRLTTIYVSQSDPDYYFGLGPVHTAFPDVPVIAAPATVAAIEANLAGKLKTWGPRLGSNGPQALNEVVMPTRSSQTVLELEGHLIEIVEAPATNPNRRYLWVAELEAVFGGTLVFAGVHVWMADTPTAKLRQAWIASLNEMAARKPKIVLPGHRTPDTPLDVSSVQYTRDYIAAFEQELAKVEGSKSLIRAMRARYPHAKGLEALELGAKVATGEMVWK